MELIIAHAWSAELSWFLLYSSLKFLVKLVLILIALSLALIGIRSLKP